MKCPKCGFHNPEGFRFCGQCAQRLGASRRHGAPRRGGAEGERRHATVLFSDLSDYSAMKARMDPEEVKGIMGRVFSESGKIIRKYGGTIERFFGDEIMALFGVPRAHEDSTLRAVMTA